MSEITKVLIGAAVSLLGVFTGWLLNYWTTRRREQKIERNVRTLLRIEIDKNIKALQDYQEAVRGKIESYPLQQPQFQLMVQSDSRRFTELPEWDHKVFDKLFSSIPSALTEKETSEVSNFHARLDEFTNYYTKLRAGHPSDTGEWQRKLEDGIAGLLSAGNPIQLSKPLLTSPRRKLLNRKPIS